MKRDAGYRVEPMKGAFWWIDRWRTSDSYANMNAEQRGVYRELIDELWLRGGLITPVAKSPWGRLLIGKAFGSTGFLPVFETREMADQHNTVGAPVFTIQEIVKVKS